MSGIEAQGHYLSSTTQPPSNLFMNRWLKMANVIDNPPIVLNSPGQKPDLLLQVFNQSFHVHSVMLKFHSEFFRKFLDSADKDKKAPPSDPNFKYVWIAKLDPDGRWHLVWEHAEEVRTTGTLLK